MERKYYGYTHEDMNRVLNFMCDIEDCMDLSDQQEEDFDVVIQCITTIMNRMKEDKPIEWDDKET